MSRIYKNVCDGCGAVMSDQDAAGWTFFNTMKITKVWFRHNLGNIHKEFDLCGDCSNKVRDILGGGK